jgi:hypothetical protein
MSQPRCGCPVPVINPPDFGSGARLPISSYGYPDEVPLPGDPTYGFPRTVTASALAGQATSLGCAPQSSCGWDTRHPMLRGMASGPFAGFGNPGLNFAAREIARLLAQVMYPAPGIWLGPVRIHMPSGVKVLRSAAWPFD